MKSLAKIDEAEKIGCASVVSGICCVPKPGVIRNEIRCAGFHGCTWYARYRSTNPRRFLRQRGLPSGMRRPKWCCGRAQSAQDQTALSLLRQWGLPSGMRRAEWGRSRAQAIIAEFPGSRGATHQELDNQELAPVAGRASRYIAASECGSLRFHFAVPS